MLDRLQSLFTRHKLLIVFSGVYFLFSIYVMLHLLRNSYLGDAFYRTNYDAMLAGTAWKPFVYRILLPKLTVAIANITPFEWQESIAMMFRSFLSDNDLIRRAVPWLVGVYRDSTYPRMITTLLIYGCLWGYIAMMYLLGRHLFPKELAIRLFAPIFGMLLVPAFSWQWSYIYDIPVLFLSSACFYAMLTRSFNLYILTFFLACLNKETALFIISFFALWFYKRMDTKQYAMLVALQCFIYLCLRLLLFYLFMHNAGFHLENNLFKVVTRDLMAKSQYFRILSISMMFFLLTFKWREKPLFLKKAFWVLSYMYVAYLLFGYPGEYRVFFDIMPLLSLLATHTLISGTEIAKSPVFVEHEDGAPDS